MRQIVALTLNDLAVSFKNKTVYLMVFIPLFVFLSLTIVDRPGGQVVASNIGVISGQTYAEGLVPSLQASGALFSVTWLASAADGQKRLLAKSLDGVLVPDGNAAKSAVLLVVKKDSIKVLTMMEGLSQLQRAAAARDGGNWISTVAAMEEDKGLPSQTLPIWVLMMVLLVGFLVIPPQVAEEKEKKLLLGLLQTPMRESAWLLAKIMTGMILAMLSISILHAIGHFGFGSVPSYLTFIVAGSFCFSSMGVLMGFLCRTQASARALGVIVYLPHLLPSALGDFSAKMRAVAGFIPSYQFFMPLKAILLDGATAASFGWQLACLVAVGLMCGGGALLLLKKRWLM
jgi:ABC-2 type transport system permease protein